MSQRKHAAEMALATSQGFADAAKKGATALMDIVNMPTDTLERWVALIGECLTRRDSLLEEAMKKQDDAIKMVDRWEMDLAQQEQNDDTD